MPPYLNPVWVQCATCACYFMETPANVARGNGRYCSLPCRYIRRPLEERFWDKVDKRGPDDCWVWQGASASNGYGHLGDPERGTVIAHVLSWEIEHGQRVPNGMCVLHDCPLGDNRKCVNPHHLWIGTKRDNTLDMIRKGRSKLDSYWWVGKKRHGLRGKAVS